MTTHFNDTPIDLMASGAIFALSERLREDGAALFELQCTDPHAHLLSVASQFGTVHRHFHGAADGITTIAPAPRETLLGGERGFSHASLSPHTDCSSLDRPPELLFFMCVDQSQEGGESVLVDMREVFHKVALQNPAALRALLQHGQVIFGAGSQSYRGSLYEQYDSGRVGTRFRLDDMVFFGAPVVRPLCLLTDLIDASQTTFRLAPGQGYVVNNTWWLHGRTAFPGERTMLRVLIHLKQNFADDLALTRGFAHHVDLRRQEAFEWAYA